MLFGNDLIFPKEFPDIAITIIEFILVSLTFAIVYLLIFNTRTRQSVHDIFTSSYVVAADYDSSIKVPRILRTHLLILIFSFLVIFFVTWIVYPKVIKPALDWQLESFGFSGQVNTLVLSEERLFKTGYFKEVTARELFYGSYNNKCLYFVEVKLLWTPGNEKDILTNIAAVVLDNTPNVFNGDKLELKITYGYDIGIARNEVSYSESHTPSTWRQRIKYLRGKYRREKRGF